MQITLFAILIFCSAFFSGSETAFISLDKLRLRQFEKIDSSSARNVLFLLKDPHKFLITVLICNTFVNIAASSVFADIFFDHFGEGGIFLSILLMSAILLVFGEVTPKLLAVGNAEKLSLSASFLLRFFYFLLRPIRNVLTNISYGFVRMIGFSVDRKHHHFTEQDIRFALSLGKRKGVVKKKEKDMIDGILQFKELNAADIMTPRINIVALDLTETSEVLIKQAKESGYSRLPVFMHSMDNVVGIVHSKNFLLDPSIPIKEFIHRPFFAPESMRIDDLLHELQSLRKHMAVVTDEYGVTSGLVTVEDILEEIVGEIKDEHDHELPKIKKIDQKSFEVSGQAHIDDVKEEVGLDIDTDEVDTIGGYFILRFGKIPQAGDVLEEGPFRIRVKDVSNNRVTLLDIEIINDNSGI